MGVATRAAEQGPACGMRPASGAGADTDMREVINKVFGGARVSRGKD